MKMVPFFYKTSTVLGIILVTTSPYASAQIAGTSPSKIVMTFADGNTHTEISTMYGGYIKHLSACAKVDLTNTNGASIVNDFKQVNLLKESQILEGLKAGQIEIAYVNAGLVVPAYETGVIELFAGKGYSKTQKLSSYNLLLIARADHPARQPKDLVGKKIAHTTLGSNSGNLAPRAYFPKLGLVPDKDYQVIYSKGHERSVTGVLHGFYDAAAVASDQYERMIERSEIRDSMFRILWKSEAFPGSSFVMRKDINPILAKRIRECTYSFKIPAAAAKLMSGADRYMPVSYEKDYAPVRFVLEQNRK